MTTELDEARFAEWRAELGFPATTTINPDILDAITSDIEHNGMPLKLACQANGVSEHTFKGWLKRYPQLQELVDHARAVWQRERFKMMQDVDLRRDPKGWTRIAWGLERTDPDNWAQKGPDGGETPKLIVQIGKAEHVDLRTLLGVASSPSDGSGVSPEASHPQTSPVVEGQLVSPPPPPLPAHTTSEEE